MFKIVLISPEIPWNAGAIGRTCVGLDVELIIIKPTIIDFSDKAVKRSGLDYWEHVKIKFYENWDDFMESEKPGNNKLFFLSTKATKIIFEAKINAGSYLIFGAESKGLPQFYHKTYADNMYKLPMVSEHVRSFNLANTATAVAFEALRQIRY